MKSREENHFSTLGKEIIIAICDRKDSLTSKHVAGNDEAADIIRPWSTHSHCFSFE